MACPRGAGSHICVPNVRVSFHPRNSNASELIKYPSLGQPTIGSYRLPKCRHTWALLPWPFYVVGSAVHTCIARAYRLSMAQTFHANWTQHSCAPWGRSSRLCKDLLDLLDALAGGSLTYYDEGDPSTSIAIVRTVLNILDSVRFRSAICTLSSRRMGSVPMVGKLNPNHGSEVRGFR